MSNSAIFRLACGRALPSLYSLQSCSWQAVGGAAAVSRTAADCSTRPAQPTACHACQKSVLPFAVPLPASRRSCRWVAEAATLTPSTQDSSTYLPPANLRASQHLMDTPEKAIEVRMESQVIFDSCWRRFEERFRLQNVFVPREVVWLNGAPGSGKGINTLHILKTRGLDTSISMSELLEENADARGMIDRGDMIPDTLVGDLLLESLLANACKNLHNAAAGAECGVLVDGFPRTAVQVDFLKLLYDKLNELHAVWANTVHEPQFPRPLFKVVMLYVDEETSIRRQMERAKAAHLHNKRVMDAGAGDLWEQRATDLSIEKCKKRYDIFKQHYPATMRLKQFFPFHLIDSMGTLEETQEAISLELRYQSSLDLSASTYSAIRHLPLSRDLAQHARQQLVSRLDEAATKHPHLFHKVIDIITAEIMPVLRESGMAGRVEYVCDMRIFNDHPRAAQMLIDVLTDRGYSASHSSDVSYVPVSLDLTTGSIRNKKETKHKFTIHWETRGVREMAKAIEIATRMAESATGSTHISQSFIPADHPDSPQMAHDASSSNDSLAARTLAAASAAAPKSPSTLGMAGDRYSQPTTVPIPIPALSHRRLLALDEGLHGMVQGM